MKWGLRSMQGLGMLAVLGSIYMIGSGVVLWARGERAEGVVLAAYEAAMTDAERRDLSARNVRASQVESLADAIDVRFETGAGQAVIFTPSGGVAKGSVEPGDTVAVLYDPARPEEARLTGFRSLFLGPLLVGLLGSVFLAMGWLGAVLLDDPIEDAPAASG